MNEDVKEAVKRQLAIAQDNLYRAKIQARSTDASQPYGQSGQTLTEIIDGYRREVDRWTEALASLSYANQG